MDNPNPIHYSDLVTPDNSISDLIQQLQDLISQYDSAKTKIQAAATEMARGMQNVSAATEEQRDQIKLSYEESDKLVKQYRDINTKQWEAKQAFEEANKVKKEQAKIDKLITEINTSLDGSYNKLSAQYRLNKIRLNEMSDEQRKATDAGRKLEAETKAIYEQMNRLQLATGKAQLQVGHYERGLLSAVGVNGKFADVLSGSADAGEAMTGAMQALKTPLGAIIGVVGAGVGVFKLWKETVNETQVTSDELSFTIASLQGVWERFAKSVATLDFSYFIRGAIESARSARSLAMVLDEVFERSNSTKILRATLASENAILEETAKNTSLTYQEREAAANKYIENIREVYQLEEETARRTRDAQLENLFTLTNTRKGLTDEQRKAAQEEFALNIKNYSLNDELIKQAVEYNNAIVARDAALQQQGRTGGSLYAGIISQQDKIIKNASDEVKTFAAFLDQYNLSNDKQVTAYVQAEIDYQNSQAALYNENKRFVTLKNNLLAQESKEAKTASSERKKAAEDAAKAEQKAAQEAARAAQEQINAQNALLQAQLQSINLEISVTKEGTQEILNLRLDAINKQREIELFQNRNKAEELRQDEVKINAKYDAQILKTSADFYTKLAEREFKAQQDLDAANFALLQTTEDEKTRFRLQAEKDRLQNILDLNKTAAEKLSYTEIEAVRATIAGIDKELSKVGRGGKDAFDLIGLGSWDDDQKSALTKAVTETVSGIEQIISAWNEAAEARINAAKESVDAAQSELESEIEARNNGYANNVAQAQKNVELRKKELADKQRESEKATKAQLLLDTVTQASSLTTASANIWSSLSSVPVVGPGLAVAALLGMWASFAAAKVKASKVAGVETYGDGTVELLQGGSHASGHDIDMGTKSDGTRRRAEGGEFFAVINKKNSRRYRDVIPDVINSFNDGTFAEKYETANAAMSGLAVNMLGGSATDVSNLEKDVRAIRSQGAESRFVDASGNTVVRYKNLTRVIRTA